MVRMKAKDVRYGDVLQVDGIGVLIDHLYQTEDHVTLCGLFADMPVTFNYEHDEPVEVERDA